MERHNLAASAAFQSASAGGMGRLEEWVGARDEAHTALCDTVRASRDAECQIYLSNGVKQLCQDNGVNKWCQKQSKKQWCQKHGVKKWSPFGPLTARFRLSR